MPITTLPPAPEPTDSTSQFNAKSFAWVAALDQFTTEANALESNVDALEATTVSNAATATTKAGEASTSAAAALVSQNAAAASQTSATNSANAASASSTSAQNSANAAATSATNAGNSATQAAASASSAAAIVTGVASNRASIRPSLLLDFANTKQLDPRVTFSRASTGTYYDGKTVAKAEENLLLQSQAFDNGVWSKDNSTVTVNSVSAPDGTTTGSTLTDNATNAAHRLYTSCTYSTNNTQSFYAKAGTANFIGIATSLSIGAVFDVSSGTVSTSFGGTAATIVSVGNGWFRCIVIFPSSNNYFTLNMGTTATQATAGNSYVGSGSTIYLWGAQLEQRSTATSYTPTTTAPITNYIPALQTAAAGVARFDHDPITGESKGLLIEEQRTNLLTYSEQFDTAYGKTRASILSNIAIAPDGTLTADKLVEDTTASNTHIIVRTPALGSSIYALSVYAKAAERTQLYFRVDMATGGSQGVIFNLITGAVVTSTAGLVGKIDPVGNGWYRCSVSYVSADTLINIVFSPSVNGAVSYSGDGYSGIYIWGAQLEAGAFPTSYIPTVASQVTRSADAASMTGSNFSSWYRADEGTVYCESNAKTSGTSLVIDDGSYSNRLPALGVNTAFVVTNGTVVASLGGALTFNQLNKNAFSYAANDYALCVNGGSAFTDSLGDLPSNISRIVIGADSMFSIRTNGTIKRIAYYPKRLSNTELQGITS